MEAEQNSQIDDNAYDEQDEQQQLSELNDLFSRFKDDSANDYINVNRLTEVLQAFGRNPSLRDSEQRMNELEAAGRKHSYL
ncbi:unnamed protein product [Rotaria socialis]|uniref:EF-hand domain-containing protein n=1 Tax=Rotaria socialis TaxID=392032 RepID=A0A821PVE8_9BILA|nr:unnamed protein product [Rotaria socialis]